MKTKDAIKKYGLEVCKEAYALSKQGNGAGTIGFLLSLTTNQADCAIDAGRNISMSSQIFGHEYMASFFEPNQYQTTWE
jgi:hypothetical protein